MGLFSILKEKNKSTKVSEEAQPSPTAVASRAKSEYQAPKPKQARFNEAADDEEEETESPRIPAYNRVGAKSFTASMSPFAYSADKALADSRPNSFSKGPKPWEVTYTSISQFQQRVELYRGSISTVYKAVCTITHETVIIKAYDRAKMKTKNVLRMEREIKLMKMLGSEGCVQLYGTFEDEAFVYLVMEFCKGGDLFKTMLMHGGVLEEHWVCIEIIQPLLSVLVKLHKQHVLHRDIKPENIFLTKSRKFKLGDLGLAIKSDLEQPFTRSGTLDYMAPEVLANPTTDLLEGANVTKAELKMKGIRPYDEKVDVWAAGILAYELVVGRPPFEVNDEVQTATMIMFSNKINFPPKHSPLWADFVRQALEKKPHIRPSAAQMLEHPWVKMHERKVARESGAAQGFEEVPPLPPQVVAAIPEIPPFKEKSAHALAANADKPTDAKKGVSRSLSMGTSLKTEVQAQNVASKFAGLKVDTSTPPAAAGPSTAPDFGAPSPAGPLRALKSELGAGSPRSPIGVEGSGGSFAMLMKNAHLQPVQPYLDSGEEVQDVDRTKGSLHVRVKRYFLKQQA